MPGNIGQTEGSGGRQRLHTTCQHGGSRVPSPGGGAKRSHLRLRCAARAGGRPGYLSLALEKLLEKPRPEVCRDKEKEKLAEEQADREGRLWKQTLPGDCETFHPLSVDPGRFLMEKGLPTSPSHLAENVLLPVAELEGKESVPGRPHCSSITFFSPQKPVQPRLVLGLWAGPPPLWGSPLPMVGC